MDFVLLIPITLFLCITYAIKAVVDARVRKQLVASNGDPALVRGILEGDETARRLASLRWGITLVALALGFGIVDLRGWQEITPGVIAVLVGAVISTLATLPLALPFQASGHDLALLALLGVVQLAIPCVLAVRSGRVLKAPEMALLGLLEVIFGILLAWLGAGEKPAPAVLTGGALVIGALVFNELLGWKEQK